MELLKIFIKDEVPAVGLTKFKEKKEEKTADIPRCLNLNRPTFKQNYRSNFIMP